MLETQEGITYVVIINRVTLFSICMLQHIVTDTQRFMLKAGSFSFDCQASCFMIKVLWYSFMFVINHFPQWQSDWVWVSGAWPSLSSLSTDSKGGTAMWLEGSHNTAIWLEGSQNTAIWLEGSQNTAIWLRGSQNTAILLEGSQNSPVWLFRILYSKIHAQGWIL